jgi:hypothetical protein
MPIWTMTVGCQTGGFFGARRAPRWPRPASARYRLHGSTRLVGYAELDHWRRDIEGNGSAVGLRERNCSPRLTLGLEQRWLVGNGGRVQA